ncbi:MAG TPA: DUF6178 family protein [Myxococcales bacterium]|nr:DUF6178 family protein [Myxococcales bacterium]
MTPSSLTRAQLLSLPAKKRMDALLESPGAGAAVRSLPVQLLYQTIAEVGMADATELVQAASPEQFRLLVDLGGWDRDRVNPLEVLTWLRAARGDDPEAFFQKLRAVDLEIVELLLRALTIIHDRDENPDADPQGVTVETPDGKYFIELRVDGAPMAALRTLINDFIAQDPFQSSRLFEAVRWEVPSEMEETAYRFRTGRLQDLGFPPLEEAMAIYAWVDPAPLAPPPGPEGLARAAAGARPDYLGEGLRALSGPERDTLEEELRLLVNSALVAEAADPGELEDLRRVGEQTRDYLSLGFEHLTAGDPSRAAAAIHQHPLRKIFQLGFSLTLDLKRQADRLARSLFTLSGEAPLLAFERASFAALRRKRPMRAVRVEGADPVPFRSRRELEESAQLLRRVEQQSEVFRALLAPDPAEAVARFGMPFHRLGADRLFAAALAHAVLDGAAKVAPVPPARLAELGGRVFEGDAAAPALRPSAAERALPALEPAVPEPVRPELRRMVDAALARWLLELGAAFLRDGRMDAAAAGAAMALEGAGQG